MRTLPQETISHIQDLYQQGQTVKSIVSATGIRYTLVYFYTVNGGEMDKSAPGRKPLLPIGCAECETQSFVNGLCRRCYYRQHSRKWRADRRARRNLVTAIKEQRR